MLLLGVTGIGTGCHAFAAPVYQGPRSEHFDGERFVNQETRTRRMSILDWQLNRQPGPWTEWTDTPPGPPPPRRVASGALRVTFVNHATTLLQLDGVNVLTDPIWSERCSPVSFVGPKRVRPPGLRFEDLPPIDAVIISHNHYDHMDLPTLKRLAKHFPNARFFAGLGNKAFLDSKGLPNVTELDWWQEVQLTPAVKLVSAPAQHTSNRGLSDRNGTLWTSYVLQGPSGVTYFAGDTGYGKHFRQVRERFGPPRLAVLPIGAYKPEAFMEVMHISPKEAVRAHLDLEAKVSVPMHFGTFHLGDDGQEEPVADLLEAVEAQPSPKPEFWVLGFGEGRDVH
ncbi:MBL fold metallo-hydrolase [Hyalangium rubrum]|uniref:MBL fold metallo-hydrolase n=1 Tax=Hyalangium rubrum TaxID=3103134 RepID=A0ABU5H3I8_9BACT|nr:MBL fold metallo-hydrolase [Hyalangium sp. s54d21]MDY7228017.1 MBL fold metallo-hydrolase [Hyalangium sp. s54d21]